MFSAEFLNALKAAADAVEAAFRKAVQSGVYAGQNLNKGIVIEVAGELVVVRGKIINGVAEVGTFFIP